MNLTSELEDLRSRLKSAEAETLEAQQKIDEMTAKETALEMQTILLNAQIGDLERLINDSDEQLSEDMTVMKAVRDAISKLKETSEITMGQASLTSSRVQMADNMYELASRAKFNAEVEILDELERKIASLRARLKP
jgi:chromosome segregation ATPase